MKVITWNMSYWSKKKTHEEAWHFLVDVLQPDVALVQEARLPEDEILSKKVLWHEIGCRGWGTGIYSKLPMEEIKIESSHPGALVVARIGQGNEKSLTVSSVYGLLERKNDDKESFATTTVHRILSDMTWILLGRGRFAGMAKNLILGGDLNVSIQCDEAWNKKSGNYCNAHKIVFERLADFGLHNVFEIGKTKEYVQTLRHSRSKIPWQNDYLFFSDALFKKTAEWNVIDNGEVKKLSDHNPVIAEITV